MGTRIALCANCNGPHTASYRGCPKYPKNITKSRIEPGKSFAAAASKTVNKPAPPPQAFNAENVNFPPLSSKPDSKVNSRSANDDAMVPNQENMHLGMELIIELKQNSPAIQKYPGNYKNA
ncbi:hypothetical protein AVEN_39433-1 [Araneus ventricosus]|uniref:Uncharacterized protein n=1 Tax=Araneus ventricosus TaxID=182803 RepID=A0A4Y2S3V4_ARAVE|nr:hypothetical protein AVEN_39433-1 [Araneus ventricosus]